MVRCQKCGTWIWFPPGIFEEHVCPECGNKLTRKGLFLSLLPVDLVGLDGDESGQPDFKRLLPRDRPLNPVEVIRMQEKAKQGEVKSTSRKHGSARRRCGKCGFEITTSNAQFCPDCGASLSAWPQGSSPIGGKPEMTLKTKPTPWIGDPEKCIVCNFQLTQKDAVTWCPHCGNPAHLTHLLEWLHAKRMCPACGTRLDEGELKR